MDKGNAISLASVRKGQTTDSIVSGLRRLADEIEDGTFAPYPDVVIAVVYQEDAEGFILATRQYGRAVGAAEWAGLLDLGKIAVVDG